MLKVHTQNLQRTDVVIVGDFDAVVAAEHRTALELVGQSATGTVVIDLSKVHFIDSSGIGAIVFLYKRLAARGMTLSIIGAAGQPLQVMHMLRIDRTIPINVPVATETVTQTVRLAQAGA